MKKYYFLIIVTLILGLVLTGCSLLSNISQVPATGQSGITYLTKGTPGVPEVFTLYAGQTIDVGTVKVWNDGVNLYVKYETNSGWKMTETHLAVVTDVADFPTNKPGNPMVGHFPYGEENIFTDTWEETIELEKLGVSWTTWDHPLYIAAHAVVLNETATGLGDNLVVNGGFELPIVSSWAVFDTDSTGLEWIVEPATPPWDLGVTQGLELQRLSPPHSGLQYAELDAYDPVRIYQDLLTTSTKGNYTLTYAWSPRPGVSVNEIEIRWNDTLIATHSADGSSGISWTVETYAGLVPNETGTTRLEFVETGPNDQLGMFLDSVSVVQEDTESAWVEGERFTKKGNWATYFEYTKQGVKVDLLPCPYNYPDPDNPPLGEVFVIFYNSPGTGYNFEMIVSLIGVEPTTEYDIHLSVTESGGWSANKVGTVESDGSGNATFYMSDLLAPGLHTLGVVITLKGSGSDIYETPGVHPPYVGDPAMSFY